jgi:hypothetical protein
MPQYQGIGMRRECYPFGVPAEGFSSMVKDKKPLWLVGSVLAAVSIFVAIAWFVSVRMDGFAPDGSELPVDRNLQCARQTQRTIEPFRRIQPGMSFPDICQIVGEPDRDVGSGIHIFEYALDDGSRVLIGFIVWSEVEYVALQKRNAGGEWETLEWIVGGE